MGALISLVVQLFMLLLSVTLSLMMSLINLTASLLRQSGRAPSRQRSRTSGASAGAAVVVVLLVVMIAAQPRLAVLVITVGIIALIVWLITKNAGRYKTLEASELAALFENVHQMSGAQFEAFMANVFKAMGHEAQVLGGSADQGVDLLVKIGGQRVAVQCKNYAKAVGNKSFRQ